MTKGRMAQLNVRVPQGLKRVMERYVSLDAHKDISELTRDALREKIQRDAPNLFKKQFERESEK